MRGILVGLGGRAGSWYNVCRRSDVATLVAYVEIDPERRRQAAERWNLDPSTLFESLDQALAAVSADFVLDVTPPAVHERIARTAMENGLHVLEEKPLSDDFAAAQRMVQTAKKTGRVHMITQNYRFGAVPRTTCRLLAEGIIGPPEIAVVGFYKAWATRPGTHYVTMPYPLITDMGIHHFDMMRYVFAREPIAVLAKTWNPSWGWHRGNAGHTAIFEFEGGLIVTHHALGSSVGKQSPWNGEWRIEGPNGSLTWEEDHIFRTSVPPAEEGREEYPLDTVPPAQEAILKEFVSAIREGRQPECSSQDNLRSLAMVFAGIRSDQENRRVEIAELLNE